MEFQDNGLPVWNIELSARAKQALYEYRENNEEEIIRGFSKFCRELADLDENEHPSELAHRKGPNDLLVRRFGVTYGFLFRTYDDKHQVYIPTLGTRSQIGMRY